MLWLLELVMVNEIIKGCIIIWWSMELIIVISWYQQNW